MSAELLALLDGLDAAREKATPGEWGRFWQTRIGTEVDTSSSGGVSVENYIAEVADEDHRADYDNRPNPGSPSADAALIVAAVNSLPKLTAALRNVLALADKWERGATRWGQPLPVPTEVHAIRAAIAAALTPEQADR